MTPDDDKQDAPVNSSSLFPSTKEKVAVGTGIAGFKIGDRFIDPPFLSAPMAGFTNFAFRQTIRDLGGVGLIATEMISARAFVYREAAGAGHPERLWGITAEPGPLAVQIWDNHPEVLAETARKIVEEYRPTVIDLNFGCPAPKIAKNSASGSALLANPQKVGDIVRLVAQAAGSTPVTAKIRLGLTADSINAVDVAQAVEEAGAAGLTVHGRTASAFYRGSADWDEIAKIRPFLHRIPLVGNGDVKTAREAVDRLRNYPVDGVMIGRAALEKPWIFRQAASLLAAEASEAGLNRADNKNSREIKIPPEPTLVEQEALFRKEFTLVLNRFGEEKGVLLLRKFAADWSRGKPGAKQFRVAAAQSVTPAEFLGALETFFRNIDTP